MENKKIYEKGTLGWLREQAKKDGFDDLSKWNEWKRSNKQNQIENLKRSNKQSQIENHFCDNCKIRRIETGSSYREIDKDGKCTGKWVFSIKYLNK